MKYLTEHPDGSPIDLPKMIIQPELQNRFERTVLGTLTLMFWTFWIYLFLPLLSVAAWYFGYDRLDLYMLQEDAFRWRNFLVCFILAMSLGSGLLIWATYNMNRFQHFERRTRPPTLPLEKIAQFFEFDPQVVAQAQTKQVLYADFTEEGRLQRIFDHPPTEQELAQPAPPAA